MPLWPYLLERNGDARAAPVWRSVVRLPAGSVCPSYFCEQRLGVERVDLRRPAVEIDVDDVFGLARESGATSPPSGLAMPGDVAPSRQARNRRIVHARPSIPKPVPARQSSSRRLKSVVIVGLLINR